MNTSCSKLLLLEQADCMTCALWRKRPRTDPRAPREVRFRNRCCGAASRESPAHQSSLTSTGRSRPITRVEAMSTRTAS